MNGRLEYKYGQVLFPPELREHFDYPVKADKYYVKIDTSIVHTVDIKT